MCLVKIFIHTKRQRVRDVGNPGDNDPRTITGVQGVISYKGGEKLIEPIRFTKRFANVVEMNRWLKDKDNDVRDYTIVT